MEVARFVSDLPFSYPPTNLNSLSGCVNIASSVADFDASPWHKETAPASSSAGQYLSELQERTSHRDPLNTPFLSRDAVATAS